ncbi:methionyl-tRNA formyltransferase [Candidatus Woesearchaeota archaeon]|nr:methionyl-tRNA formyltransferase [Candidatus Woesearchaeota archaeon]
MRILFAGTPEFAVPPLQALLASTHELVGVYTRPDSEAGRGLKLKFSPVKALALQHGVPVFQPPHFRQAEDRAVLQALAPDLMVVVAYGLILPTTVLHIPRQGCINIHASLLPRWRGAAPIQRAVYHGDRLTGITLMQMDEGLDTGPVLLRKECPILPEDTGGSLHDRLSLLGATALMELLPVLEQGAVQAVRQSEGDAVYATKLSRQESPLDWNRSAHALACQVRAFNPWPVAETRYRDETLKIWQACTLDEPCSAAPGCVLPERKTLDVATGQGVLRLLEVQRPGGKRISAPAFLNAHSVQGERLGDIT